MTSGDFDILSSDKWIISFAGAIPGFSGTACTISNDLLIRKMNVFHGIYINWNLNKNEGYCISTGDPAV